MTSSKYKLLSPEIWLLYIPLTTDRFLVLKLSFSLVRIDKTDSSTDTDTNQITNKGFKMYDTKINHNAD